jgi:hypothetical protein
LGYRQRAAKRYNFEEAERQYGMSSSSSKSLTTDIQPVRHGRWDLRIDLTTLVGVGLAVLLLRLAYGLLLLFISTVMPQTALEVAVGVVPGQAPFGDWLQRVLVMPWVRYDAWNYQRIVEHGYVISEGTAAFHPLYPLLAWPLAALTGNAPLALLLISTLATASLAALFVRYTAHFHEPVLATRATWLLLLAPPAFILLAIYNESTFLLLAVAAVWAMNERRWWLAGLLGGLAALTRQQGLALGLPLGLLLLTELWGQIIQERAANGRLPLRLLLVGLLRAAAITSLVPLGYGLFVGYRALVLGDLVGLAQADTPFAFLRALLVSSSSEQVVPGQRVAFPWEPLFAQLQRIFAEPGRYPLYIDLLLGWGLALVVLIGLQRMTPAEGWYCVGILVLSLCYYNGELSPYLSLPRHLLLAFPLYIALARWLTNVRTYRIALEVLFVVNIFLAGAYARLAWIP